MPTLIKNGKARQFRMFSRSRELHWCVPEFLNAEPAEKPISGRFLCFVSGSFNTFDHTACRHLHRIAQSHQHINCRRFLIQFQQADVLPRYVGLELQVFLRRFRPNSRLTYLVSQHVGWSREPRMMCLPTKVGMSFVDAVH